MAIKFSEQDFARVKALLETGPKASAKLQAAMASLPREVRGALLVSHLQGRGDVEMSTDEIMDMTRGE